MSDTQSAEPEAPWAPQGSEHPNLSSQIERLHQLRKHADALLHTSQSIVDSLLGPRPMADGEGAEAAEELGVVDTIAVLVGDVGVRLEQIGVQLASIEQAIGKR